MVEYSKVNVKLSDSQLDKLKNAVKDKTGTTLRMSLKMFAEDELPHELPNDNKTENKIKKYFS